MAEIYDEDNDEFIDDKTGEPTNHIKNIVNDVIKDIKITTIGNILKIHPSTREDEFSDIRRNIDVLEEMMKTIKRCEKK